MLRLAGGIIRNDAGEILLLHRNTPERQQWEIPGGKIDDGETAEQTVIRELQEELCVTVAIDSKLGEKEFTEDGHTMSYTWFAVRVMEGMPQIGEPHRHDAIGFFSVASLAAKNDLSPNARNFVNDVAVGEIKLAA